MRKLMSEQGLEITVPDLYGEVNESIVIDMVENSVSEVYVGVIIGDKLFGFIRSYEDMDFGEVSDRVFEDNLDCFANLQESLACGSDEITVDSIVVIVE